MANQKHLDLLKQGVETWNKWRQENPNIQPDLSETRLPLEYLNSINLCQSFLHNAYLSESQLEQANLANAVFTKANLMMANLYKADLSGANLAEADLTHANLAGANLSNANLFKTNLTETNLADAKLVGADLSEAVLFRTILTNANLSNANLLMAILVETILIGANLTGSSIYGISAWKVQLGDTIQLNLIITPPNEPTITVDSLEIAQFISLLLNNIKIREVIDTITSKVVLILGRFTDERKKVLDALRDELRTQNYTPVLFDFEKPSSRDFTETISTLAHLARFIIVDITEPSSIPQELQAIIPTLEVPVQPLLLEAKREYAMFVDFRKYQWVLPVYLYKDQTSLLASLKNEVIEPAEKKARELAVEKAKRLERP